MKTVFNYGMQRLRSHELPTSSLHSSLLTTFLPLFKISSTQKSLLMLPEGGERWWFRSNINFRFSVKKKNAVTKGSSENFERWKFLPPSSSCRTKQNKFFEVWKKVGGGKKLSRCVGSIILSGESYLNPLCYLLNKLERWGRWFSVKRQCFWEIFNFCQSCAEK